MNRLFNSCAALICLIAIAGCEARRMVYSGPHIDAVGVEKNNEGLFVLSGMNLAAVPNNADIAYGLFWYVVPLFPTPGRTSDHESNSFWMTLIIDPEGEDFSLDLQLLSLELNGRQYFPSSFRGPVGSYGGWRRVCDELPSTSKIKSVKTYFLRPHPVTEWSCFLVKFDLPAPPPEQSFILRISGIYRDGKSFPVPPIHFQKNLGWQMHRDL